MKILILTVNYGNGHKSVCNALNEILTSAGHEVIIKNPHREHNNFIAATVEKAYERVMSNWLIRQIYMTGYKMDAHTPPKYNAAFGVLKKGNRKTVESTDADVVIHTFPCHYDDYDKLPQLVFVTDYYAVRAWTYPEFDKYFVANELTKEYMMKKFKLKTEEIGVTGIPVDTKFLKEYDVDAIREELGYSKDKKTVLITFGAYGKVDIPKVIKNLESLSDEHQYLIVCGKNEKMFNELKKRFADQANMSIYGFVNTMEQFISLADIMVSKAGGISVSEAISTATPIIINEDECIPLPEGHNVQFIKDTHIGVISNNKNLIKDINKLASDSERIERFKRNMQKVQIKNQEKVILDSIEEAVKQFKKK